MYADLVTKYNVPVPRYTSYPTVPLWEEGIDLSQWEKLFVRQFNATNHSEGISIYIHLPFCESLCTYCGCNKKISSSHAVELPYIDTILKEWIHYTSLVDSRPVLRELHIGGGTPTFFSAENLQYLIKSILDSVEVHPNADFSFEGHPNNTTLKHLEMFFEMGFKRVSFGVQDNDLKVQQTINRVQPLKNLVKVTEQARALGYESINYDLIYGLPKQTIQSIQQTIEQVINLRPDRIAFYSYAHVPWTSKGQRLFDETDLPTPEQKLEFYDLGKNMFIKSGYIDIGMDHFALPNEQLSIAYTEGKLHRNFMGYTTQNTTILIGLGVSAISDLGIAFGQNDKVFDKYVGYINQSNNLAISKGYFLTDTDYRFRKYILDIICKGNTQIEVQDMQLITELSGKILNEMKSDELLNVSGNKITITQTGKRFVRNICSALDIKLQTQRTNAVTPVFSSAV